MFRVFSFCRGVLGLGIRRWRLGVRFYCVGRREVCVGLKSGGREEEGGGEVTPFLGGDDGSVEEGFIVHVGFLLR